MENVKQPPQFNTKGTPCNIVDDCTSGKPALYVVGTKYACIEHRQNAFDMAKKGVRTPTPEPEVEFTPEVETVELDELEVGQFSKLIDD